MYATIFTLKNCPEGIFSCIWYYSLYTDKYKYKQIKLPPKHTSCETTAENFTDSTQNFTEALQTVVTHVTTWYKYFLSCREEESAVNTMRFSPNVVCMNYLCTLDYRSELREKDLNFLLHVKAQTTTSCCHQPSITLDLFFSL